MKFLKLLLFFAALTALCACKQDIKQELEPNTIPEYIKVSKIKDSEWIAVSNWAATLDVAIIILKKK